MDVFSDKDSIQLMSSLKSTGVFVTCGLETPNIMVTHWGSLGRHWGKDIFFLPIRSSKFSYKIVTETKSFVINVPSRDMRTEISLCDTISGFTCNKFETLNLHPKRARSVNSYVLGECGLIAECRVVAVIPPENIIKETDDLFISKRPHTLFAGEIIDAYRLH